MLRRTEAATEYSDAMLDARRQRPDSVTRQCFDARRAML